VALAQIPASAYPVRRAAVTEDRGALGGARSEREWAKTTIPVSKVRPGSIHRYHKLKKLRGFHDK